MDLNVASSSLESIGVPQRSLSVVIPTHRRPVQLRRLLESLAQNFSKGGHPIMEVIVVSNLPDRESRQVAESFFGQLPILYLEGSRVGVNVARNLGLHQASSDIVAFLDDDCVVDDPLYTKRILDFHQEFPDAVAIGGTYKLETTSSDLERAYHSISHGWMGSPSHTWSSSWRLLGGNVSYKKSELSSRNLSFDEDIVFGGAESELHQRMSSLGLKAVLHTSLSVVHDSSLSFWGLIRRALLQGVQAGQITSTEAQDHRAFSFRLYQIFFDFGHAYGQLHPHKSVRLHWALLIHVLVWLPVELLLAGSAHQSQCQFGNLILKTIPYRFRCFRERWVSRVYWFLYPRLYHYSCELKGGLLRLQGFLRKWSVRAYWKLYKWHWIVRGPLQYQAHKRLGFVIVPLSQGARKIGAMMGPVREGSMTSTIPRGHFRSWLYRQLPLFTWSTETLQQLWWQRCRIPTDPAVIVTSWSSAPELAERLQEIQGRRFRRVLIETKDFSQLKDLENLNAPHSNFEIEVLLPPSLFFLEHKPVRGMTFRLHLDVGQINSDEKLKINEWIRARSIHSVCISPLHTTNNLNWFSQLLQSHSISEVRILDILHRSAFDYSTALATIKKVLWSWPSSVDVVIETPVRAHLDHLPVPARWPRAQCFDLWKGENNSKVWSIVIPCFQNAEYLPIVISHIQRQNYDLSQVEVLIIDDGSDSNIVAPLRALRPNGLRVRVVRIERQDPESGEVDRTFRAGVARNSGVPFAEGENLLFIDSDIVLPPDHLSQLDQALTRSDVIQSVRQMLTEQASHPDFEVLSVQPERDVYAEDAYWENFKSTNEWSSLQAPWKYVCTYHLAMKRAVANGPVLFRPEFCEYGFEDTEFGYRKMKEGWAFHILQEPVYHLYPLHRSTPVHFDAKSRRTALRSTSRAFFRMYLDPSIAKELDAVIAPERHGHWESPT